MSQPPPGQQPYWYPTYGYPPYGYPPNGPPSGYPHPGLPYPLYGQPGYEPPDVPPPVATTPAGSFVWLPGRGWVKVAGMGRRLSARLIDTGLQLAFFAVLAVPAIIWAIRSSHQVCTYDSSLQQTTCSSEPSGWLFAYLLPAYGAAFVVPWLYNWLMVARYGATFGKKWLGLRVVRQASGSRPGYLKALLRELVLNAAGQLCYVGYFSPLFDSSGRRQGWHDRAGGTLVVEDRS